MPRGRVWYFRALSVYLESVAEKKRLLMEPASFLLQGLLARTLCARKHHTQPIQSASPDRNPRR